jgi:hypothetical protein
MITHSSMAVPEVSTCAPTSAFPGMPLEVAA